MKRAPAFLFILLLSSPLFALTQAEYDSKIKEVETLEKSADVDRKEAEQSRKRAEEYRKLEESSRKAAEEYSRKAPQNVWKPMADKARRDAENNAQEAERMEKQAAEAEGRAAKKSAEAEAIRRDAETGKPAPPPAPKPESPKGEPPSGQDPNLTGPKGPAAQGGELPVEEIVGKWKNRDDDSNMEIDYLYSETDRPHELSLSGKYSWACTYGKNKLNCSRSPGWEQMNEKVPEWARRMAAEKGGMRWWLELKVPPVCGERRLTGNWYPGEIKWNLQRDPNTGEAMIYEAKSTGAKGEPVPVSFVKLELSEAEEKALKGEPDILVRLADQKPSEDLEQQITSVALTAPFYIDVLMNPEQAAEAGGEIKADLKAVSSGLASSVTLKKQRTVHGVTHYTHDKPVRLARNELLADSNMPDLWYDFFGRIKNGDDLEIRYKDVILTLKIYTTYVQQGIAQNLEAIDTLEKLFDADMRKAGLSEKKRELNHHKLQMVANARRLMGYQGGSFTDLTRLKISGVYVKLLSGDERTGVTEGSDSSHRGMTDQDLPVAWVWDKERDNVMLAIEEGKKDFSDSLTEMATELSVGLFQVTIGNTVGGNAIVVVWGLDAAGNPVDITDRIFTGVDIAAGLQKFSASAAKRLKGVHTKGATSRRVLKAKGKPPKPDRASSVRGSARGGSGPDIALKPDDVDVNQHTLTRWPDDFYFENPGRVPPMYSKGTPIQFIGNTCGLNVLAGIRRDEGFDFLGEVELLRTSHQKGWYKLGNVDAELGVLGGGGGMRPRQMADALTAHGATVGITMGKPVAGDIEKWMARNKRVTAMINTGTPDNPGWHWVRVEGMRCGADGTPRIVFGDPWNGKSWEVNFAAFRRRMHPDATVVAQFPAN